MQLGEVVLMRTRSFDFEIDRATQAKILVEGLKNYSYLYCYGASGE